MDTSRLPLEQGIICSLRESFGFIHCAERPQEVFFHYSEVSNCHPDELQIDTEVEFRVGESKNDSSKLAAYEVITLPTGTVVWETEDQPEQVFEGLVEKSARHDQRNSIEGTIRVLEDEGDVTTSSSGQLIRFRSDEYQASKKGSTRLFRGDLVQFRILTDRRTKQKYARFIALVLTEKEKKRIERERKLLENAVEEEGVVVSLNNGFGFIKSNKRRDHIYFHYSNLTLPEDNDDFELKKGQELKFLVVAETDNDDKEKRSARSVVCLPEGSVVFHNDVAQGIKGVVEVCPRPPIGGDDVYGTIRLVDPIMDGEEEVKSALLEFSDAPGGTYTYKHHSSNTMGLWIESGDTLLFDVVKELADGSYRAAPTRHTLGEGGIVQPPDEANLGTPTVRLYACSLVHRADGVVHTVKESSGYGFLHFSERPIDVHFKTFNFLPEELQSDLRKQLGYDGKPVRLEAGTAVQFDICAHGKVTHQTRGRRGHNQERENIKGHRILLLPQSAVEMEKFIKKEVKGVVKSVNARQAYSGAIELEEDLEPMTIEERHPLVAKMIHSFLEECKKPNGRKSLVFRDIVSVKEDDVVVEMVERLGGGLLDCGHIGMAGSSSHPGRLCIRRVEEEDNKEEKETDADGKEKPKKEKKAVDSRQIHFDKSSLNVELKEDVPLGRGDIVKLDVSQSRRTGRFVAMNLTVIERNESSDIEEVSNEGSGQGIVREVVPKRNFGFISVLDDTATKRESLFFHLSDDKDSKRSIYRKGDEVKFDIALEKSGKRVALNIELLPKGTMPVKATKNACQGFILMEPSHTTLSDTPLRKKFSHLSTGSDKTGGRWDNGKEDSKKTTVDLHDKGCILLIEDKTGMFKRKGWRTKNSTSGSSDDDDGKSLESFGSNDDAKSVDSSASMGDGGKGSSGEGGFDEEPSGYIHVKYKNGAIAIHGTGSASSMDGSTNPRRGDLVSFVRAKSGVGVRDVRIVKRQVARFIQGRLEKIEVVANSAGLNRGKARFIAATEQGEEYDIDLREVVSCDASALKEKQPVEAILHEGKLYGVCRTADLYLGSKLGTKNKERPKLNLSVKKNRGGTIMAQSMMAKVCLPYMQ